MRRSLSVISTIPILLGHPLLYAQGVATTTLPKSVTQAAAQTATQTASQPGIQTTAPSHPSIDLSTIPFAIPLPPVNPDHIVWECDTQSRHGEDYLLAGDVEITYGTRHLRADTVRLDNETGEIEATGHLRLTDTANDETINASHGTYNLRSGTGRFYDAAGSAGLHRDTPPQSASASSATATGRLGLQNSNPFLFSGRILEKTGPEDYTLYDGTVTSCLLPRPDWLFSSRRLVLAGGKVHSADATFRLLGVPILFFPYLTAPATGQGRQSGLLIPVLGDSSTKGITVGENAYITLGRSADLTVGTVYYSLRGFSESGTFRYRGHNLDFITGHVSALQDRGYTASNGVFVNQGGEDLTAAFRRQLTPNLRAVGDGEYLSSYIYREAFTDSFNQAVSSDITSIAFVTEQTRGWSVDGRADRYQGLKQVPIGSSLGEQVHILHVPSVDLDGIERSIPGTPFVWSLDASIAGLKRAQPNFTSSGIVERVDVRPELSLPLHFAGWNLRASLASRETFYSRSRKTPYGAGAAPVQLTTPLNRADLETEVSLRPPTLERSFAVPARLTKLFGAEVRHTLEPELTYRDVRGVNNFLGVLRFDDADLVSDTNEVQYGLTQHLYFRPQPKSTPPLPPDCPALAPRTSEPPSDFTTAGAQAPTEDQGTPDVLDPTPADSTDANGIPIASAQAPDTPTRTHTHHAAAHCTPPSVSAQQPLLSWRLTQRVFLDETFGHAIIQNRRNIFDTTLSLSGIAFLTEPRRISPLVSRLRLRTSGHTDAEWDFDYDTGAKKFTSSNTFFDAHEGNWFGGLSYARLNAPGRFATEVVDTNQTASLVTSPVSNFSQLRFLIGYGIPTRPGLSIAANTGLDLIRDNLQYAALQTSYNWNCCGLAVEYRKYNLGTVRDENSYRFNFTLANIGSAGNIRRAERLF